jgi:hypothetical protein
VSEADAGLDSSNRLFASVLGLVLVAAGGYGLVRSLGGVGVDARSGILLDRDLRANIVEYAGWVGGAATFLALLLAWLGWRWLRRQLVPSSPVRRVAVGDGRGGRSSVDAGALAEAVTRDLLAGDGVAAGRGRIIGREGVPGLSLTADVAAGSDPQTVRRHVADHVVPRARTALGRQDLAAHLHLRLGDPEDRALE